MTRTATTRRNAQELDPLTDSLASRVRWRISDYAAIVRAELDLLLAAEAARADRLPNADRRLER